jgi:hypothetical protein
MLRDSVTNAAIVLLGRSIFHGQTQRLDEAKLPRSVSDIQAAGNQGRKLLTKYTLLQG